MHTAWRALPSQMHGVLKRSCFLPLVKRGAGKTAAGFSTFVASALYHELQFGLSFPSRCEPVTRCRA